MNTLDGRVALVTGGSSGIGKACVEALAACGAKVAFTYNRGADRAEAVRANRPDSLSAHCLDLRDSASIQRVIDEVRARWGRLHILVNNAAAGSATIKHYEPDSARQDAAMMEINAVGALAVCNTGIKAMQENHDEVPCSIINIGSVGGPVQVFPHFQTSDAMSKAAVAAMTKKIAAEIMDGSIRVNCVCPGATETNMLYESTLSSMNSDELRAFCAGLPGGRLIQPEEVADIVVFLASDLSRAIHGAVIDASMGLGVRPGKVSEMRV